jgi:aryl-alcohol dehydrogenase-like predicted oxidoreductase
MIKETRPREKGLSRRGFLGSSLAAAAGWGWGRPKLSREKGAGPAPEGGRIREYRPLGRTGFKVSDVSFGSGELAEPALLGAILDAGVNYIDTAEGYGRGRSERLIGQAIRGRDRKKIFVTTKLRPLRTDTKQDLVGRAEKCLERLRTEYIDCLMIHAPHTVEALLNPVFHDAIADLKARGRVRFCGVSNHGSQWDDVPETMEHVLLKAAEDGRFDVMLFVYNFLQKEGGERILEACKKHDIGATLMKTNPVLNYVEVKERNESAEAAGREVPDSMKQRLARLKERADRAERFRKRYGLTDYDEVRSAAIRFVLSHPDVSCACPTIKNFSDLEFYTALSGKRFDAGAGKTLALYQALFGEFYCRHACGECESACPHGVPVNTIMRYNHYFRAQGREKTALLKYAALPARRADTCRDCEGPCESACRHGVPIQGLLIGAHETLTLA